MRWNKGETVVKKGTHKRATFLVCVPTFGIVSIEYHISAQRLQSPVNSVVQSMVIKGEEVGKAREQFMQAWKGMGSSRPEWCFMYGDDIISEWWHLIALYEEAVKGRWDVLSGLYHLKQGIVPTPILWRDPIVGPLKAGRDYIDGEAVISDIVGMDFTLIHESVLDKVDAPYFQTSFVDGDQIGYDKVQIFTEDAFFCKKVREAGGKVGCHTKVKLGHLSVATGEIY